MADPLIQINVFGMSGDTIIIPGEPGNCFDTSLVTATKPVQKALMAFVDTLNNTGNTDYKIGIIKAISLLDSQERKTRHSGKTNVIQHQMN